MKNKAVKSTITKEFRIVDKELPIEASKLIKSYKRKYPFTYLSAMSKTYNQGLAHCTKKGDLAKFGINPKTSKIVEMPNGWIFYIQQLAIDENRVKYIRALGLDFLFSPFVLVYESIKESLSSSLELFVLQERGSITLFIADKDGVYFGGFFMMGNELESGDDGDLVAIELKSVKEMSDLDSIIGSIDELHEIGELEGLDEELIRKEFAPEELESNTQESETSRLDGLKDLARASNASEILKNSISEFYSNPIYSARFIESVVILDSYGMTDQAIEHMRTALMLDVSIRRVDIPDMLISIAQNDLKEVRG